MVERITGPKTATSFISISSERFACLSICNIGTASVKSKGKPREGKEFCVDLAQANKTKFDFLETC